MRAGVRGTESYKSDVVPASWALGMMFLLGLAVGLIVSELWKLGA